MLDQRIVPPIIQSERDNCMPACIEAIVRHFKPLTSIPDQIEIRQKLLSYNQEVNFRFAASVMNTVFTDLEFQERGFSRFNEWKDVIIDNVKPGESLVAISTRQTHKSVHIRVVVRIESDHFMVYDPADGREDHQYRYKDAERDFNEVFNNQNDPVDNTIGACRDMLIVKKIIRTIPYSNQKI